MSSSNFKTNAMIFIQIFIIIFRVIKKRVVNVIFGFNIKRVKQKSVNYKNKLNCMLNTNVTPILWLLASA